MEDEAQERDHAETARGCMQRLMGTHPQRNRGTEGLTENDPLMRE